MTFDSAAEITWLSVMERAGLVLIPTNLINPDGIGILSGPVERLPFPSAAAELASALERAHRRSGKPTRATGLSDSLTPACRTAGCKTEREFVRGLRQLSVTWLPGRVQFAVGLPVKNQAFEYSDTVHELPGSATFLDVAEVVLKLLSDPMTVRPHAGT